MIKYMQALIRNNKHLIKSQKEMRKKQRSV